MTLTLKGPDEYGYLYGQYQHGDTFHNVNILPPYKGDLHGASLYVAYVDGEIIAKYKTRTETNEAIVAYIEGPKS